MGQLGAGLFLTAGILIRLKTGQVTGGTAVYGPAYVILPTVLQTMAA